MAHSGALDQALDRAGGTPLIYPLFMTDGWFVRSVLPKRLGDVPAHILPPLGVDPELVNLVTNALNVEMSRRAWAPCDTHLLVASHGSGRSPKSKEATETFVERLSERIGLAGLRTGYVEEAPFFKEIAQGNPDQTLCLPFFAAYGGHVKEDITEALSEADFKGDLLNPIGTFATIPGLIANSLRSAM